MSVAEASPVFAGSVLSSHSIVVLGGHTVMVGTVVSSTITDWEQVLLLPHASVAVQVLVIEYSCGHAPATVASL